ncbi:MAG: putative O-glycosylation ligase, exosortase A system-associated [Pseudomonadota bacterium]
MRDVLVFLIVFGSLPFIFRRPAIGVMMFAWLSLMNPHRLTYGAAFDFPFAAIVSVVTLLALLMSKRSARLPMTPVTVVLILFACWMSLTSLFALEPQFVWAEWNRVMKTCGMILVAILALRTKGEIRAQAMVIGLSLGFYGIKGGVFTITSGGGNHVYGPEGSYITDNNALALALVTALPIIWYLHLDNTKRWLRLAFGGVAALTVVAAAGSYSRGALLGGAAMFFFLWIKSRQKVRVGLVLLLVVPLLGLLMPDQWFDRMQSIDNYQQDASAMGRINAWYFAFNVAKANFLGGGFSTFSHAMFAIYAPEPFNHHAAHSIYFQVLGEHGFVGLFLFLLLMFCAWRTGSRILRFCKNRPELKWASNLAAMCQVSIIGYAVGGAFLTLAYYDLYYYIVALLVSLERLLMLEPEPGKPAAAPTALAGAGANGESAR